MSIGNREWKLWREGEPFSQRFTATLSEDGNTITGRWEIDSPVDEVEVGRVVGAVFGATPDAG
jgi:hypothetical protein